MPTDSLSTDLASVIFAAAGGSVLLVAGLLALGLAGSLARRMLMGPRPRGGRRLSVAQMLRAARASDYAPAPILNRPEKALFAQVEEIVRREMPGCRVMGQVALSEVVRPAGRSAGMRHATEAVLGRSLDMAVVDRRGLVLRAIEYQGGGHYQGNAELRDEIKAEILSKAGIDLVAVPMRWEGAWLRARVTGALAA